MDLGFLLIFLDFPFYFFKTCFFWLLFDNHLNTTKFESIFLLLDQDSIGLK